MEYLSAWMFLTLTILLLMGFPVAFTLLGTSLFFGLIGFGWGFFNLLPLRIWGIMTNFTLAAVPLFIFMGVMLERSGIAKDLLRSMGASFGSMRGGLAISVVIVGALLGASTGIVGATVVTMGLLALPTMLEYGYNHKLASGTIATSGTLGQIIPPSIVLVLLGDIIGVSIGDLFIGAVIPGFIMVFFYIIYIITLSRIHPEWAPSVSLDKMRQEINGPIKIYLIKSLISPLLLIVIVLGSIFFGIASPTEAAGVGALGATVLCLIKGQLTTKVLKTVTVTTVQLTSMVFIILVGATAFGLVFRGLGGDQVIRDFISHLPFGKWGVLFVVMAVIFITGFFLDFIEITFIYVPVLAPILKIMGFDPVWFAILFAINLQTSFLTPPFGFSLFYLKGVAPPGVTTLEIYRGVIPFVMLQILALGVVVLFPKSATWLPSLIASLR